MIRKHYVSHADEKSAQFFWTMFILMFFMIQACIWSFAISVTARDTSHAVVAGYDEQALTWDEVKSAKLASSRLAWHITFTVSPIQTINGNRNLILHLTDGNQEPILNARLEITCFHRAAASQRQTLKLNEAGPGIYTGKINVQKFGKWCFTGTATVGSQRFLFDEIIEITKSNKIAR